MSLADNTAAGRRAGASGGGGGSSQTFEEQYALRRRINMLAQNLPTLAEIPEATYALASDFSMTDDEMLRAAIGATGDTGLAGLIGTLQGLSTDEQRARFYGLSPTMQQSLLAQGYTVPQAQQPGSGGSGFLGSFASAVSLPFRIPGTAVQAAVGGLLEVGNASARNISHAYRAANYGNTAAGGMTGSGGLTNLLNGPMAFGGSSAATMMRHGPLGLLTAWSRTSDGEEYVAADKINEAAAILGSTADHSESFFGSYGGSFQSVNDRLWLARKLIGGHDLFEIGEAAGLVEGTDEWNRFMAEASEVMGDKRFADVLSVLEEGKSSFGRDAVRATGLDATWLADITLAPIADTIPGLQVLPDQLIESMTLQQAVSGSLDAAFTWYTDPFDRLATATRLVRAARVGVRMEDINEGLGLVRAVREMSDDAFQALPRADKLRFRWAEQVQRMNVEIAGAFAKYDEHIAAGNELAAGRVMTQFIRRHPSMNGVMTGLIRAHRLKQVNLADADEVWEFWRMAETQQALLTAGRAAGITPDKMIIPHLTEFQQTLARKREWLSLKLNDPNAVYLHNADAARSYNEFIKTKDDAAELKEWKTDMVGRWKTLTRGDTVGEKLLSRPRRFVLSTVESFLTHVPRSRLHHLDNEDSIDEFVRYASLFERMGFSRAYLDDVIGQYLISDTAGRNLLALQFTNLALAETGLIGTKMGQRIHEVSARMTHAYSAKRAEDLLDVGGDLKLPSAFFSSQLSDVIALPDSSELLKVSNELSLIRTMGLAVTNGMVEGAMRKIWIPAQLMRLGFIPRAGGEETISYILRRGPMEYIRSLLAKHSSTGGMIRSRRLELLDQGATRVVTAGADRYMYSTYLADDTTRSLMVTRPLLGLTYWMRDMAGQSQYALRQRAAINVAGRGVARSADDWEQLVRSEMDALYMGDNPLRKFFRWLDDGVWFLSNRGANVLHGIAKKTTFLNAESMARMMHVGDDEWRKLKAAARAYMIDPTLQSGFAHMTADLYEPWRADSAIDGAMSLLPVQQNGRISLKALQLDPSKGEWVGQEVSLDRFLHGHATRLTTLMEDPVGLAIVDELHQYLGDHALEGFTEAVRRSGVLPDYAPPKQVPLTPEEMARSAEPAIATVGREWQRLDTRLTELAYEMEIARATDLGVLGDLPSQATVYALRRQARTRAQELAESLRGQLTALRAHGLSRPPKKVRRRDPLTGQVTWSRPAEWEWFDNLPQSEQRRIMRNWRVEGDTMSPDNLAMYGQEVRMSSMEEFLEEWVSTTRQIDALESYARTGRLPSSADLDELLSDDTLGVRLSDLYQPDAKERLGRAIRDQHFRGKRTPEEVQADLDDVHRQLGEIQGRFDQEMDQIGRATRTETPQRINYNPLDMFGWYRTNIYDNFPDAAKAAFDRWVKKGDDADFEYGYSLVSPEAQSWLNGLRGENGEFSFSQRTAALFFDRNFDVGRIGTDINVAKQRAAERAMEILYSPAMASRRGSLMRLHVRRGTKVAAPPVTGAERYYMPTIEGALVPTLRQAMDEDPVRFLYRVLARIPDTSVETRQVLGRWLMEMDIPPDATDGETLIDVIDGFRDMLNASLNNVDAPVSMTFLASQNPVNAREVSTAVRQVLEEMTGSSLPVPLRHQNGALSYVDLPEKYRLNLADRPLVSYRASGGMVNRGWLPLREEAAMTATRIGRDDEVELLLVQLPDGRRVWVSGNETNVPEFQGMEMDGYLPRDAEIIDSVIASGVTEEAAARQLVEDSVREVLESVSTVNRSDVAHNDVLNEITGRMVNTADPMLVQQELQFTASDLLRSPLDDLPVESYAPKLLEVDSMAVERIFSNFMEGLATPAINAMIREPMYISMLAKAMDEEAVRNVRSFHLRSLSTPEMAPDVEEYSRAWEQWGLPGDEDFFENFYGPNWQFSQMPDHAIEADDPLIRLARSMQRNPVNELTGEINMAVEGESIRLMESAVSEILNEVRPLPAEITEMSEQEFVSWFRAVKSGGPRNVAVQTRPSAVMDDLELMHGPKDPDAEWDPRRIYSRMRQGGRVAISPEQYRSFTKVSRVHATAISQQATAAAKRAVNLITPFIDDHRIRSQWQQFVGTLVPFWFAEEQFIKRWARGLIENPAMLRRGQLTVHGMMEVGLIQEDSQGNRLFVYPGSEYFMGALATVSSVVPDWTPIIGGFGEEARSVMVNPLSTNVEYMLPGVSGEAGRIQFGPIVAVTLSNLAKRYPELAPTSDALLGDVGAARTGAIDNFVPAYIRGLWNYGTKNEEAYASAQFQAMQYLAASGHLPPEGDPAAQQEFLDRTENIARSILLTRTLSGYTFGASAVPLPDDVALHADLQMYLDAGLPFDQAFSYFLDKNPDASPYTVFQTTSPSGAPIAATQEVFEFLNANGRFLADYPTLGPWFAPQGDSENFGAPERRARNQAIAQGLRVQKTPRELLDQFYWAAASEDYFETNEQYEQQLVLATSPDERRRITQERDAWKTSYMAMHPVFQQSLTGTEGLRRRAALVEEARVALANRESLPGGTQAQAMLSMLEMVVAYDDAMDSLRGIQAGQAQVLRNDARIRFYNASRQLVAAFPELQSFWNTHVRPLLGAENVVELEMTGTLA